MASYDDTATVSGSVVSIENGADEVGAKSCVVTVRPTISGVSSVTETHTGRNLFDEEWEKGYGINSTTGEIFQRQDSAISDYIYVKPSTNYYITGFSNEISSMVAYYDINKAFISRTSGSQRLELSFTTPVNCYYIILYQYRAGDQTASIDVIDNLQTMLEIGSTAHAYEPYQTPTTYTADLGRTINGGTADIVNGEGEKTHGQTTLTENGWTYYEVSGHSTFNCLISGALAGGSGALNGYTYEQVAYIAQQSNKCFYFYASGGNVRLSIRDDDYTDTTTFGEHIKNSLLTYPLATPEAFTFDGQEIPTKDGYNAFWSEQGDTELTYYKSGYGFTSVTVNKTGKNLIDGTKFTRGLPSTTIGASIDTITTSNRYAYYGIRAGGGSLTVSSTSSDTDYFTLVLIWGYKDGVLTYYSNTQPGTSKTVDFSNCDYVRIGIGAKSGTTVPTDLTGYGTIQLELGSQATEYEPYEAVSKTAYLHKVIYGGKADVIRGTCEPKNLLKNLGTFPYTISASEQYYTEFSNYIQARKIPLFALENNVTYTLSLDVQCSNEPFYVSIGVGDGRYLRDIYNSGATLTSGRVSITFTPTGLTDGNNYLAFRAPRYGSKKDYDVTVDNVQLEKASSATDFAPYFEPFSFPPISMSTDEGENTLFANEGDSAITYRKAVD